jgi:hypothetical protein
MKKQIKRQLRQAFKLIDRGSNCTLISVPRYFPDGDGYTIYFDQAQMEITDYAHTFMRMSYQDVGINVSELLEFKDALRHCGASYNDGKLSIATSVRDVCADLISFVVLIDRVWGIYEGVKRGDDRTDQPIPISDKFESKVFKFGSPQNKEFIGED